MKAHITITDGEGHLYEGSIELSLATPSAKQGKPRQQKGQESISLSYGMNLRAFMKKHAAKSSGPEKFAILLARLAEGRTGIAIKYEAVRTSWERMKSLLGKFNPAYALRAKENGWIDSPKTGTYELHTSWTAALKS
jgi:hypothetical protein